MKNNNPGLSVNAATSAPLSETGAVFALLDIIADPAKAKATLEQLAVEKQAVTVALDDARATLADAETKFADAQRVANENTARAKTLDAVENERGNAHATRTKSLDDRHEILLSTDKRLNSYETQLAARDKDLTTRENAVKSREADVTKREAALRVLESQTQELKETLQRKVDAFRAMQEELKA